jgi:pyrimidine/purine-5'-nucleotide nucleosidase
MRRVEEFGPLDIHGDGETMAALDALLRAFVVQRRMKIAGEYRPCYTGGDLSGHWRQQ